MITYNPKDWFKLIFQFHKSDTFRVLVPSMILLAVYAALITFLERSVLNLSFKNTTAFHSILGFVLSMLLVFRVNSAYDRWWEGRKLWGSFVNNSRNLAMKLHAFLPGHLQKERNDMAVWIGNYMLVAKEHLRGSFIPEELVENEALELKELAKFNHKPNRIAMVLFEKVNQWREAGYLSQEQFLCLNEELKSFTDIIGACERIKNTPIPYAYSLFLKKIIFIYAFTMPLGFCIDFGYWCIPMVVVVFYAFTSLELISEEIEDPFGEDANDLPTDEIAEKISSNVKELLTSSR